MEQIEPNFLEYIELASKEFNEVRKELDKHLSDKYWQIPNIKMEMPLDSKEIQPEKIDDW